jgi:ubiquinone/menaquinone biosynthesis C-methylase UbiE
MLAQTDISQIEMKWNPESWPAGAGYDYARAMHRKPYSYYRERVRHLGLSGGVLVDAGCGSGTWSFALAGVFDRVLAIDYTRERIEAAAWLKSLFLVAEPEFQQGDIRALPLADGMADAVFCYSVLLGTPPLDEIYHEFHRVLRPGGVAYVELNGIGYGYNLLRGEGRNRSVGAGTLYNTYCQTDLQPVVASIEPGGPRNKEAIAAAVSGSPMEILRAAEASSKVSAAGEAICNDLGGEHREIFLSDLTSIAQGARRNFSRLPAGRGYTPIELESISKGAGFQRFEWAHEGMLSLQADGSVTKAKCPTAPPISAPEFEGHLRRFESLAWK